MGRGGGGGGAGRDDKCGGVVKRGPAQGLPMLHRKLFNGTQVRAGCPVAQFNHTEAGGNVRLLYCYVKFLNADGEDAVYRGLRELEFNLSPVSTFSFDRLSSTLSCEERKSPLPEHFWDPNNASGAGGTNIYNVNVICGENGSGKSTAMHYLIDLLDGLYAAVEPQVDDRDRMQKLGVSDNVALLLLEDEGRRYLLHYSPHAYGRETYHLRGFPEPEPEVCTCHSWQELAEASSEASTQITRLLRKTKVVYLTNTLNQHDYERHVGGRNERLRDYFVYDASIGATIGPDVSQFFPYEVYKQVKYVFDPHQKDIRDAVEDSQHVLKLPTALRLCPRVDLARGYTHSEKWINDLCVERSPSHLLGALCAVSFADNRRIQSGHLFAATSGNSPSQTADSQLDVCKALLQDVAGQFISLSSDTGSAQHTALAIYSICFSPNGLLLASGCADGTVRIWDTVTGKAVYSLEGQRGQINSVCFSPDGHRLASGCSDGTVLLWDMATRRLLRTLADGHQKFCSSVCFSPGGQLLAGGFGNGTVRLWDTSTGEQAMMPLGGHGKRVTSVSISLNGQTIAIGSLDNTVCLYDVTSGKQVARLPNLHRRPVNSVCFSPDGRLLASGSADGTVRLWDTETKKPTAPLLEHGDQVRSVCFSPDGRLLASGSTDGTVRLWYTSTGEPSVKARYG